MKRLFCRTAVLAASAWLCAPVRAAAWTPETHAGLTEAAAYASTIHLLLVQDWGRPLGLYEPIAYRMSEPERHTASLLPPAEGLQPRPVKTGSFRHSVLGWLVLGAASAEITSQPALEALATFYDQFERMGSATRPDDRDAASVRMWLALGTLTHALETKGMPPHLSSQEATRAAWLYGRYGVPEPGPGQLPERVSIAELFGAGPKRGRAARSRAGKEASRDQHLDLGEALARGAGRVTSLLGRLFSARLDLKREEEAVQIVYEGPRLEQGTLKLLAEGTDGIRKPLALPVSVDWPLTPGKVIGPLAVAAPQGGKLVALVRGKDASGDTICAIKELAFPPGEGP